MEILSCYALKYSADNGYILFEIDSYVFFKIKFNLRTFENADLLIYNEINRIKEIEFNDN